MPVWSLLSLTPSAWPSSLRSFSILFFGSFSRLCAPFGHSRLWSLASWVSLVSYWFSRASSLSCRLLILVSRSPAPGFILYYLLFGCPFMLCLMSLSWLAFYLCSFDWPLLPYLLHARLYLLRRTPPCDLAARGLYLAWLRSDALCVRSSSHPHLLISRV